jgi:hypothetical protein
MSSGIQKFVLKTRKSNQHGKEIAINKYGKGKNSIDKPFLKYKMAHKNWFGPKSEVFMHKKIQTPIPTPISLKTGDRVEKSRSTKELEKIKMTCMPNGGKTTMRCH